jgi:hypothetical protein
MNERIQELAKQAKVGPVLLLQHYGNVDALTDSEQEELKQIQKFAELLIRECLNKIENEAAQYHEPVWAVELVNDVKDHFGMEP